MIREALTADALDRLEAREAAALFVARRAEGLTDNERQLLDGWLRRDDSHRRAFESAARAWESFEAAEGDEILAAMRAHARAPRRRTLPRWWPAAAAAAAVLVIALPLVLLRSGPGSTPGQHVEEITAYASATGDVKLLQLADGSQVALDADSALEARYSVGARRIALQKGRALFDVQPDASRPFSVSAAGRSIVAVGTQFDVNIVGDSLTVTLIEGRVDIAGLEDGRALVTLEPGQQFIARGGDALVRGLGADTENVIAWRKGFIHFDDQPLSEAAAVMNRYSREQIVVGPEVASARVSGQFRAGDTERFAATLADLHRLDVVRRGDTIELRRRK